MNNAPKVATQEISDAELDNVAGGIASPVGDVLGTVDSVTGPVTGALGTVTATVDGVTGLNTTGIVGGVVGSL
ncbi:type A2 lantipeptide [Streptomyces sp. 4503]|uniref:Type A2 lantipeptide n=1 Tax=Streptomyces niphimycinicus TaxID=2842201 RepID=A0ABS6CN10_9ACTN|nr:type A2 lantipeptide [Streptomyces niphimycinicus]MBU3868329.1 type A2 lantipeptide [Streptomyces niphimycinicus]